METSKIAIASLIYSYRKTLGKLAKLFFVSVLIVLIAISSIGVYAYLSASYEAQSYNLTISQNEITELHREESIYERDIERFNEELDRIDRRVDGLSQIGSREIEVRDTTAVAGIRSTVYTAEFRAAQQRINEENERRNNVLEQRSVARDSLRSIRSQIAEARLLDDSVEHLGPLIFVARVFDVSMDKVMNILTLVITAVLDPIAVALIVAANFTAEHVRGERSLQPEKKRWFRRKEKPTVDEPDKKKVDAEPDETLTEDYTHEIKPTKTTPVTLNIKSVNEGESSKVEEPADEKRQPVKPTIERPTQKELTQMTDEELLQVLKRDTSKRAIDVFGENQHIDGYDINGDGMIEQWTPDSSMRWRAIKGKTPHYANKNFDWSKRDNWVYDQNAINYWLTHIKRADRYPDDFTSKIY